MTGGIRQKYRVYILEFMCLFGQSKTRWMSYKKQERFALGGRLVSPQYSGGDRVAHLFSFLCCVFCLIVHS